jgi:hypothetical protein
MKKFFLFLSTGLLLMACNDQTKTATAAAEATRKNTDMITQNLKGKVQSINESSYAVDSMGKMGNQDSLTNTSEFTEPGYQSRYITKDNAGKIKEEQTIAQYENGAVKEFMTKKDGKQAGKWEIILDSSGNYKEARVYDSANKMTSYWTDLSQDEYGQVTKGTKYTPDHKMKSMFENSYKNGIFTGSINRDSSGKETFRSSIQLDEKGNAVSMTSTTKMKDTTKTETKTYKYDNMDEKGNWTQRTVYNEKGKPVKIEKRTYTYYKD